jgi:hypothetical protein
MPDYVLCGFVAVLAFAVGHCAGWSAGWARGFQRAEDIWKPIATDIVGHLQKLVAVLQRAHDTSQENK